MAVKCGSRAITVGSLVYSTGQNSTPGLSATKSYSRALPSAVVVTILLRCVAFSVPVITPPSTRSIIPSPSSSVCTPSSLWSPSRPSTQSGTAPMPACSVAPSGIRSATSPAIARSRSPMACGGSSAGAYSASQKPTRSLTCSWLPPKVRGSRGLTSTKNGTSPISAAAYSALAASEK